MLIGVGYVFPVSPSRLSVEEFRLFLTYRTSIFIEQQHLARRDATKCRNNNYIERIENQI